MFRQVYEVAAPTFQLKLDLFTWSKQTAFDAALRMPNEARFLIEAINIGYWCILCVRQLTAHTSSLDFHRHWVWLLVPCVVPIPSLLLFIQGQILVRMLGWLLLEDACWTAHCLEALVNGRLHKTVGHVANIRKEPGSRRKAGKELRRRKLIQRRAFKLIWVVAAASWRFSGQ